jgi:hypothetical protein
MWTFEVLRDVNVLCAPQGIQRKIMNQFGVAIVLAWPRQVEKLRSCAALCADLCAPAGMCQCAAALASVHPALPGILPALPSEQEAFVKLMLDPGAAQHILGMVAYRRS